MSSDASASKYPIGVGARWLTHGLDWLTRHERYVVAVGIAFQVVFLAAMMVRPLITLATGETILLRIVPVDPRDLFRGDYVILNYEINRPGWDATKPWDANWAHMDRMKNKEGQPIYVLLEPEADGKHWRSTSYQFEPPSEGKFIRGTVSGVGSIKFGIEQYFVEEGQGHDYEKAAREKKLSAEVALDKNGSAQIKRLIIE
jgi:uncharacterized membrane-anchored protein